MRNIPLWLKVAFTAWILVWAASYSAFFGSQNFLWLCDLGNFILLLALWRESRLLFSTQVVALLIVDVLWSIDFAVALAAGIHPFGATGYMFNPEIPLHVRSMSLFHLFLPPLLVFGMSRLGYARRGLVLQTGITWVVLPATFLLTDPERNINWVWGPFFRRQELVDPALYLLLLMIAYPLLIYVPTHRLVLFICRRRDWRVG